MAYNHLTEDERYTIYEHLQRGRPHQAIADMIGRSKSTVSREIRRNRGLKGYRPGQADRFAAERRRVRRGGRQVPETTWGFCQALIKDGHSPEQAAGRARRQGQGSVSHEYLYQRVYADKRRGGSLWRSLRCQKRRRKRYGSERGLRGRIPNRVGNEKRCPRVEKRAIIGHWEGDTVVGKNHKGFLVTLVERRSGYALVRKVPSKSSAIVAAAIVDMLRPHKARVRTLTFDNGLEFATHQYIAQELACSVYFARPYASWQRGTNENFNGLLRQYLPKRSSFAHLTADHVACVQDAINRRARKRLTWASPDEVFGSGPKCLLGALAA